MVALLQKVPAKGRALHGSDVIALAPPSPPDTHVPHGSHRSAQRLPLDLFPPHCSQQGGKQSDSGSSFLFPLFSSVDYVRAPEGKTGLLHWDRGKGKGKEQSGKKIIIICDPLSFEDPM